METKVVDCLIKNGWHVAFAESCTGGLLCGRIINVPNASAVLDSSFVTYANAAKVKYLGVSEDTIAEQGVVSEAVAGQMAKGVAAECGAEVGVATSGIAGPSGGTVTKPVGMVCFGFWIDGRLTTVTKQFGELGRNQVREAAVRYALETLYDLLRSESE